MASPIYRYGKYWQAGSTDIDIELQCYKESRQPDVGGLGKFQHAVKCIDLLWNYKGSHTPIEWTPWLKWEIETMCAERVTILGGGSSSGKSHGMGIMCLLNYLASPCDTICIVTSTSIEGAKLRIFKSISTLWREKEFPGKLVESKGRIRGVNYSGTLSDSSGIIIVPCGNVADPRSKFIGIKSRNMHVYYDELSELPVELVEVWRNNLQTNEQGSKPTLVAASNPCSKVDAFGILARPKNGWTSVDLTKDLSWTTEDGKFIRFDITQNPRITEGREDWKFYPSQIVIDRMRSDLIEGSNDWNRFVKATFSNDMETDVLISEQEVYETSADLLPIWGSDKIIMVCGIDPSYTHGGDKTEMCFCKYGRDSFGVPTLCLYKNITVSDTKESQDNKSRNILVCSKIRDFLEQEKVSPEYVNIDSTGEGGFVDILASMIGKDFNTVTFGGKASKNPISPNKPQCANELFSDRVSELWGVMKMAINCGQVKGLTPSVISDITSRKKKMVNNRICVEQKREMKKRIKRSPDKGDALAVAVDLIRRKFNSEFGYVQENSRRNDLASRERKSIYTNEQGQLMMKAETYDQYFKSKNDSSNLTTLDRVNKLKNLLYPTQETF